MHAHTHTHISLAYNYVVSGFIITDTLSVTLVRLKVLGPKLRLKSQTRNKDRCALIIIYCLAKRPHKSCGCYWCGCSPGWYMRGVAGFACCLHAIVAYAYINEHAHTHTHTHICRLAKLQSAFKIFDKNGDGKIDVYVVCSRVQRRWHPCIVPTATLPLTLPPRQTNTQYMQKQRPTPFPPFHPQCCARIC